MSLMETLKSRIMQAMRDRNENTVEKDILRVALGEAQLRESNLEVGQTLNDEDVEKIIRKIVKSNKEVLRHRHEDKLVQENKVLNSLVPELWDEDQIYLYLSSEDARMGLLAAKSDGHATGLAIKSLKAANALIDGDDVKAVVARIRAEKDACEVCKGEKGGVPGNENVVDGKTMCDYCHAETLQ